MKAMVLAAGMGRRLRPLTVGVKGAVLYLSSEEAAIRLICPDLDQAWIPMGGEPIVGSLERPLVPKEIAVAGGASPDAN